MNTLVDFLYGRSMTDLDPHFVVRSAIEAIGVRELARRLGHAGPSKVAAWKAAGRIPPSHWEAVNDVLGPTERGPIALEILTATYQRKSP